MGAHRVTDRDLQDQRCRAFRLPQGNPDRHRQWSSPKPHRGPDALELQAVKLKNPVICCERLRYTSLVPNKDPLVEIDAVVP